MAVTHHVGNENSRRAVEKYVERFGGQHDCLVRNGGVDDDGTVVDHRRYSISREEYRRATAGSDPVLCGGGAESTTVAPASEASGPRNPRRG